MGKRISRREIERRAAQRARSLGHRHVHQDGTEVFEGRADQVAARERELGGVSVTELQSFDQIIG